MAKKIFSIRLDPETKKLLEATSKKERRSVGDVIRLMLEAGFKKVKK